MNFFKKIDNNFIIPQDNWWKYKGSEKIQSYGITEQCMLDMWQIADQKAFNSIHKRKFFSIWPDAVSFTVVTGDGYLAPHVDYNTSCSLNYYIQADTIDSTFFYNPPNASSYHHPGKTHSSMFKFDDVKDYSVDHFNASSGDAYLLNVSQIHSVFKKTTKPRIFIAYIWRKASFDEVLDDLILHNL
jgi:hypothetical protein